jgi:hypothetical protein
MSGEIAPKKIGRGYERNLDAGPFQPMVSSFELHLRAEKKSPKTIRTYLEAAQWFAAEYLIPAGLDGWADVKARDVQEWTVTLLDRYSDAYASNQFRALQQFFKWHATEDLDEPRPNPVANLKPPKIGDKLVPVFTPLNPSPSPKPSATSSPSPQGRRSRRSASGSRTWPRSTTPSPTS